MQHVTPGLDDNSAMDTHALRDDQRIDTVLLGHPLRLHSTWALFSPRAIDEGSRLLLDQLSLSPDERVLDIGCGYGTLGLAIARACPTGSAHLVDKDFVAVDYARANAERNGIDNATVYLSNGLSHVPPDTRFSLVVSNLPAKVGNEMFHILFEDSHRHLEPGGRIVVVTINGLRAFIKRAFNEHFGNYKKLKQGKTYTVAEAVREG